MEQLPARPRQTRGSLVAPRPGPALAAGSRASARPPFLGASQLCPNSGVQARAPVPASARVHCARPTRPGGLRSPAPDRPPRLNPVAPLGFLGCTRWGGDFLPAPPPPRHEGRCSVRRRLLPLFFFTSPTRCWKLTEFSSPLPIPPFPQPPGEAGTPASLAGTPTPSTPTLGALPQCPRRSLLVAPPVLQTFSSLEKHWGRAIVEKLSAVH